MITVFYDGKCGLCSREINHYRKIAPPNIFDWQDITESNERLQQEGISLVNGLKILHAKDTQGQLHLGVDAFILIWKQLKRWQVLAKFIALPLIYPLAKFAYHCFAKWRFARLAHCQLAKQEEDAKDLAN